MGDWSTGIGNVYTESGVSTTYQCPHCGSNGRCRERNGYGGFQCPAKLAKFDRIQEARDMARRINSFRKTKQRKLKVKPLTASDDQTRTNKDSEDTL